MLSVFGMRSDSENDACRSLSRKPLTARGEMLRIYRSALPGDRFDHWRCVVGQWCPRICDRPFAGSYWSARCSRESTNSCSTLGTFGVWRLRTVSHRHHIYLWESVSVSGVLSGAADRYSSVHPEIYSNLIHYVVPFSFYQ
jgi:hypothetical protein